MDIKIKPFLRSIDLTGTFVLAIQGASIAAVRHLDALGVLVISLVSAMGGGVLRDILIGAQPPEALRNWVMVTVALAGGLLTFLAYAFVSRIPEGLLLAVDVAGLSLLVVAGTEKALEYGLGAPAAIMMGALTGVGGGTIRDVLLAQVPAVLRTDFIASSALIGATVLVLARRFKLRAEWAAVMGGATCGALRLLSALLHCNCRRRCCTSHCAALATPSARRGAQRPGCGGGTRFNPAAAIAPRYAARTWRRHRPGARRPECGAASLSGRW
jgi:uncharacterized membrane protein YeiH